ncbi:helix-turn-helix domain-containing protein [bacterium]|nr:helix-turn-helix domain-containing protein [bacterium]
MGKTKLEALKDWRKKFGLSQKKFSEIAQVSLETLRQIEIGRKRKPHKKTLKKLRTAITDIEKKGAPITEAKPPSAVEKKVKPGVEKKKTGKKRGRPPKKAGTAPPARAVKAAVRPSPSDKPVMISNLDLELINRILSMSNKEKLTLLQELLHS